MHGAQIENSKTTQQLTESTESVHVSPQWRRSGTTTSAATLDAAFTESTTNQKASARPRSVGKEP